MIFFSFQQFDYQVPMRGFSSFSLSEVLWTPGV